MKGKGRLQDHSTSRVKKRHIANVLALARCRYVDCSLSLSAFFLTEMNKEHIDLSLHQERRMKIFSVSFNLESLDDYECLRRYRFMKKDICRVITKLGWRNEIFVTSRRGYQSSAAEAFCVLTRRLSTPCRWRDLEEEFGRSSSALCEIFYETLERYYTQCKELLCKYHSDFISSRAMFYAEKIYEKGSPLDRCVGFIDATNVFISRPNGAMQRATYNGHKKRNSVKFQAVTLPDGIIFHVSGPLEGRRHDITLLRESGIEEELESSLQIYGNQYYMYADSAYPLRPYLIVGFSGSQLDNDERSFNTAMSKVRISVEWAFKDVRKYFTHLDMSRKMTVAISPVGLWFFSACILCNFRTCFYGSQTSKRFDCEPPSFEQYIELILD